MMLDGTLLSDSTRRIFLVIAMLAVAGAIVSSVSLYHHYGTSQTTYCDFGETFNCDIVNRSTYSTILGVPVALIGIAGYLTLLVLSTFYRNQRRDPGKVGVCRAERTGLCTLPYLC